MAAVRQDRITNWRTEREIAMGMNYDVNLKLRNLHWQSDWNGDEVGFDDADVVGLYTENRLDGMYAYYIDLVTMEVLDFWKEESAEEEME